MTNFQLIGQAISELREAQNLGANHPAIHYSLGLCYLALNEKESAIEEYNKLKDKDGELANQLLARIGDYKPPKSYTKIDKTVFPLPPGTEVVEKSQVSKRDIEECKKEADKHRFSQSFNRHFGIRF
jgi:tetratricopeptide (TPR) repeat protein